MDSGVKLGVYYEPNLSTKGRLAYVTQRRFYSRQIQGNSGVFGSLHILALY